MRIVIAFLLLAGLPSIAASQTSVLVESNLDSTATLSVIEASRAIIAAFGADDPDTYFELFDPNATFIFHTSSNRLENRSAYEEEWAAWRRDLGFQVVSCASSNQLVQLLGDTAILSHSVQTVITTNAGTEHLNERETIVFQKIEGRWVAVHEHLSPMPIADSDS